MLFPIVILTFSFGVSGTEEDSFSSELDSFSSIELDSDSLDSLYSELYCDSLDSFSSTELDSSTSSLSLF